VHSRLAAHAEETATELRAAGSEPIVLSGPIQEQETSAELAAVVRDRVGVLDILVTSAGIDNFDSVDAVPVETWDEVVATNLRGAFLVCRALMPAIRQPGGTIVFVASASALVGTPRMAAYSASKGGIVALAREMAVDYAGQGIRVNAICPGSIDTPMLRAGFAAAADPAVVERDCVRRHPLGRLGTAEDVAYGALYLASDEASFVTGATLVIDGGYTSV
jgi:NAD(P)-dependent dehydrogenase (short-subunit alcohol dehydrogenase family)